MAFVRHFSDKTASCLKSSALAAYLMHVMLLIFGKKNKKRLIQRKCGIVPYLLVETEKSEGMREADIGRNIPICLFWTPVYVHEESVHWTSATEGSTEMCTLHQSMNMVLDVLELICTV